MDQPVDRGRQAAFPNPTFAGYPPPQWLGLTVREWYAGMALQGMLPGRTIDFNQELAARIAKAAFAYADAMIAASSGKPA